MVRRVITNDPQALDFIEQLLPYAEAGSALAEQLGSARDLLETYNFAGAEALLAGVEASLII